jgi:ureidoglycolate lyase
VAVIKLEPITAEAFAPFGQLLPAPEVGMPRLELIEELQNLRNTAKPRLSHTAINPKTLPLRAVEMERHVSSSQVFIPYDCNNYLVKNLPTL